MTSRFAAHALARTMSSAWVRFAATGDPNGAGVPHWPVYGAAKREVMLLDERCGVAADPEAEERALMAPLLGV